MPQYGQSPWAEAGAGIENLGGSMARIALAQQIGRQKAQQFAQQQALEQAYLRIAQDKGAAEIPEIQARTGVLSAQGQKAQQDIARQNQMDDLARAVAGNMFQKQVPGGVTQLMAGGDGQDMRTPEQVARGMSPTNVGPTQQNADALNQGDLVRNAVQLIGMNNPAQLEQMMRGVNIPRGGVNLNELTGVQTMGQPGANEVITPYQQALIQLGQDRLAQQGSEANRRMDAQDQKNLQSMQDTLNKLHMGLSKLYESQGELDKASEEAGKVKASDGQEQDKDQSFSAPKGEARIRVRSKDGQVGTIPQSQLQDAIKAGYTQY